GSDTARAGSTASTHPDTRLCRFLRPADCLAARACRLSASATARFARTGPDGGAGGQYPHCARHALDTLYRPGTGNVFCGGKRRSFLPVQAAQAEPVSVITATRCGLTRDADTFPFAARTKGIVRR